MTLVLLDQLTFAFALLIAVGIAVMYFADVVQ